MNQKQQLRKLELYAKMQAMREQVKAEKRLMTPSERKQWESICKEFDQLGNEQERRDKGAAKKPLFVFKSNPVSQILFTQLTGRE